MDVPQRAGIMVRQVDNVHVSLDFTTKLVPIVTIEPHGSNCFYSTMALNMPWKEMHGKEVTGAAADMEIVGKKHGLRIARLRNPQTRVTSLGVASPSPKVVHKAMMRTGEVTCVCVPDEMIMNAAISFAGNETPLSHLRCDY